MDKKKNKKMNKYRIIIGIKIRIRTKIVAGIWKRTGIRTKRIGRMKTGTRTRTETMIRVGIRTDTRTVK